MNITATNTAYFNLQQQTLLWTVWIRNVHQPSL